jgi:hypothetical protein
MADDQLWMDTPEEHDYPAALDYLTLLMSDAAAAALVAKLKAAGLTRRKAKDILRASGLPLLPRDNAHVAHDLKKIRDGKKLSPVLLVRGDRGAGIPLAIADGYHRICASWHTDENALIPCRLV